VDFIQGYHGLATSPYSEPIKAGRAFIGWPSPVKSAYRNVAFCCSLEHRPHSNKSVYATGNILVNSGGPRVYKGALWVDETEIQEKTVAKSCGRFVVACILCSWSAASTWAQQPNCQERTVLVSIQSLNGTSVPEITPNNFQGTYRGQAVQIGSVTLDREPRRIVLLLDTSNSVLGNDSPGWQITFAVADDLLASMPQTAEIGFATFAEALDNMISPTRDRQRLKSELSALRTTRADLEKKDRRTALWDAIRQSIGIFGSPQMGDVLYIITDGQDNHSKTELQEIQQKLLAAGIRVFVFDPSVGEQRMTRMLLERLTDFFELVKDTGGMAVHVPQHRAAVNGSGEYRVALGTNAELERDLRVQYTQMLTVFRLTIHLPTPIDKPRDWNLALAGLEKPTMKNLHLFYPKMFVPCS
jgi:hypothetical protein